MSLETLQQLHDTLSSHDGPVLQEIAAEMDRLWLHPDGFEQKVEDWESVHDESYIADLDTHVVFYLGVMFGTEYERRYPRGENEDWPEPCRLRDADPTEVVPEP